MISAGSFSLSTADVDALAKESGTNRAGVARMLMERLKQSGLVAPAAELLALNGVRVKKDAKR